ncbi:hypothetical protein LUZ60_009308 [Juncus effusus]|nr:hypothetical protein LUZ60_009308 [Juncus effusus]
MGFFKLALICFVTTACICGSRGQNIVPSSPSFADSPRQHDDMASSPADITTPRTVLPPSLAVPLPKGSNPPIQSPPAPIVAQPPVTPSSPVQSPPVTSSSPVQSPQVTPSSPVQSPPVTPSSPVQSPPVTPSSPVQSPPVTASSPVQSPPVTASSPVGTQPQLPPVAASSPVSTEPRSPPVVATAPVNNQPIAPVISGKPSKNAAPPQGSNFQASPPIINTPILTPPPQLSPPVLEEPTVGNPTPSRAIAPAQRNVPANPPTEQPKPNTGKTPPSRTLAPGHAISPVIKQGTPPVPSPPVQTAPLKGSAPVISPVSQKGPQEPTNSAKVPINSHAKPPNEAISQNSPLPSTEFRPRQERTKKGSASPSVSPSSQPPISTGDMVPPPGPKDIGRKRKNKHFAPPLNKDPSAPTQSPVPSIISPKTKGRPSKSPAISPVSLPVKPNAPPAHQILTLPPPPPNLDCNYLTCQEPLTDPPTGSPCKCVLPIKVALLLSKPLFAFFPLVSDFAQEIGSGVKMEKRQVRVMGANVASDQPDKTVVLVNLVPVLEKFDNGTAFETFERVWGKRVVLKESLYGNYEVLYVIYPGLPPSPPSSQSNLNLPFGTSTNSRTMKPLGADVVNNPKLKTEKNNNNASIIAMAVFSSLVALIVITAIVWVFLLRRRSLSGTRYLRHDLLPNFGSSSAATGHVLLPGRHSSASGSLSTSLTAYSSQAKSFSLSSIQISTNYFHQSRILGEGGFGVVYKGVMEDGGREVAVKVLREGGRGGGEREFVSEVEMLGRLHHRNLVRLVGICAEEEVRCLVYELVPNGSVESHLHGQDKEGGPLDWNARMKIALGAARGLAYLHEDSSPCVIHRDFKSSNILLDHDFTPKVSDFGLARAALGEGNQHISTRVMGTFGYVAPEYAMTGHLLVKSDVYSYGVVLLELLTGRKPVDMSRPAGQENLVTWARPLLTSLDGLRELTDPGLDVAVDVVAKVAAIASMCVQPEVSHRPSMGEVVQALKLVCNESDEYNKYTTCSQELLAHAKRNITTRSTADAERVLLSEMLDSPPIYNHSADFDDVSNSSSFRRYNSSGQLIVGKNRWQKLRSNTGSMSDHGTFETRSDCSERWFV